MGDKSQIQWTDATWNPILGCTKVSAGCVNCYAIRTAHRNQHFPAMAETYAGLTEQHAAGSLNWTGLVKTLPERLDQPLHWKKPRRIFVNSMSDLFHESVPDEFIDRVVDVMWATPGHTYQVLTKRAQRMHDYWWRWQGPTINGETRRLPENLWLGVSVEDQAAADERIPWLQKTPAAVRFLSCEPLLGPVDLGYHFHPLISGPRDGIGWVIVGGESGGPEDRRLVTHLGAPGLTWVPKFAARGWVRSIRDQCHEAGVPFFLKQWGGPTHDAGGRELDGREWNEYPQTA